MIKSMLPRFGSHPQRLDGMGVARMSDMLQDGFLSLMNRCRVRKHGSAEHITAMNK